MKNKIVYKLIAISFILVTFFSCDSSNLKETSIDQFIGIWQLEGRSMFNGIEIEISKSDDGELNGKVTKINNEKYVKIFVEIGDTWVKSIKRSSNYKFKLVEKKIANKLFAIYGQNTSTEFNVQFIDENSFGLSKGTSNPFESSILYKRKTQ